MTDESPSSPSGPPLHSRSNRPTPSRAKMCECSCRLPRSRLAARLSPKPSRRAGGDRGDAVGSLAVNAPAAALPTSALLARPVREGDAIRSTMRNACQMPIACQDGVVASVGGSCPAPWFLAGCLRTCRGIFLVDGPGRPRHHVACGAPWNAVVPSFSSALRRVRRRFHRAVASVER